jgi:hypothetical protein
VAVRRRRNAQAIDDEARDAAAEHVDVAEHRGAQGLAK